MLTVVQAMARYDRWKNERLYDCCESRKKLSDWLPGMEAGERP